MQIKFQYGSTAQITRDVIIDRVEKVKAKKIIRTEEWEEVQSATSLQGCYGAEIGSHEMTILFDNDEEELEDLEYLSVRDFNTTYPEDLEYEDIGYNPKKGAYILTTIASEDDAKILYSFDDVTKENFDKKFLFGISYPAKYDTYLDSIIYITDDDVVKTIQEVVDEAEDSDKKEFFSAVLKELKAKATNSDEAYIKVLSTIECDSLPKEYLSKKHIFKDERILTEIFKIFYAFEDSGEDIVDPNPGVTSYIGVTIKGTSKDTENN